MQWYFRLSPALALTLLAASAAAQTAVPANAYLVHVSVVTSNNRRLAGAEIRVDDTVMGVTDDDGQYYMARRPMRDGAHVISAAREGFETASRTIAQLAAVSRNPRAAGVELQFKLAPQAPAAKILGTRGRVPATQSEPNYNVIPIFYATDRRDTKNSDPVLRYSSDRSTEQDLAYGICEVSIPATHKVGEIESPSWWKFEYRPDPAKHVVLKSVERLDRDPFYAQVAQRLASSGAKEVAVFIHGYNTSFEYAARQAAQIADDTRLDGAAILYSWPSKDRLLAYTEDEDTVQWTAFHLRAFLDELAQRSHASKIHLIAHSMGNRALTSALQMIASREQTQAPPFDQVVMAAPDVGADTFTLMAGAIKGVGRRMTLYASKNDDALLLSGFIHGATRAGQDSGYLMVAPGIDTVDASAIRTDFLGHTYFDQSGSIIDDINKLFTSGAPPELRNLLPATVRDLKYWIVPGATAAAH